MPVLRVPFNVTDLKGVNWDSAGSSAEYGRRLDDATHFIHVSLTKCLALCVVYGPPAVRYLLMSDLLFVSGLL